MQKLCFIPLVLCSSCAFAEGFIKDSTLSLTARNFYFDRDYTRTLSYPAARDWAQGFILEAKSGYTQGPVQLGVDVLATVGYKLDADARYAGTGLLPRSASSNQAADHYADLGLTGKIKIKQTEIKIGSLRPMTPVLLASPARLLPQLYRGISLDSSQLTNLKLTAAYLDRVNQRDSTDWEKIKISGVNGRFRAAETDAVYYLGGNYQLSSNSKLSVYYMDVKDLYNQSLLGIEQRYALNAQNQLLADVRYYRSRDDGQALAGEVDNDVIMANFALQRGVHKLSVGTLSHFGQTAFPYLSGGETGMFLDTWPAEFLNAKERAYSIRYEVDLKHYVPGLRFMTRYTKGVNIYAPKLGGDNLKEDELDFDVGYRVQSGWFKNLGLRARYAIYDNNMSAAASIRPAKETRINIDYTWKFK
jgi:hypothetical protein